ncbi:MAG: amino acid/amide ABC transporter substrate-binding protein, HAAT family [Rhodobacteraceae bacterium HLUCCO07]|nr:MAG: amino acid/amide ABC transporter substrate-binding protein, HAAT family [Rhodobacteraceae bacterium HLUCCO07]
MVAVLNPIRKSVAPLVALLSMVWLAGCDPVNLSGPAIGDSSINTSKPVPVALLVPSGSDQSGDEKLAQSLENAARLAAADLDGVEVDLRVYATAGNAEQAQEAAERAVDEGARIILGPVYAESANAVGNAVADKGVNVLAFSNNTTIAGGNVFVLGPTFDNTADRLVEFAGRQDKSRILLVHSDNLSGELGSRAIENAISEHGATLAGSVEYTFSQDGVIDAIPRIKDTVRSGEADSIFFTSDTAGALPLFAQMLPEAGLGPDEIQFAGLTRWDIPPQTLEMPGVQGGWFALPDPNRTKRFAERYSDANDSTPHPIAGLAYDGIAAIGALVESGRSNALSASALTQGAGFQGATGIFRLRSDGTNERGLAVARIRDKQVDVIEPAPRAFGGAGL